jgi:RNA polymerase sigma factor (sigma-70 family)
MNTDNQLLAEYTDKSSEAAFRELVQRHINMVHSAALREAGGNAALAEDLTQEVFTQLARRAPRLSSHPSLAGWLYTCVRQMAANTRRAEHRRQRREQETFLMNELLGPNSDDQLWQQVRPVLDDVMHELDHEDRTAVVLRFFEGLSLKEVGVALGLNENAARMRVERSLEKLHARLSRRGIHSTASTLAAVLVAGTVLHTPSTFASSVATSAMASASASHATAFTLGKILSLTKSKTFVLGSAAILASGLLMWKHFEPKSNSPGTLAMTQSAVPATVSAPVENPAPQTPAVGTAAATNSVATSQMALQLLDSESGDPLSGAKLYLFYLYADGRGKVFHEVTDDHGRFGVNAIHEPYRGLNMFVTAAGHVPKVTTFGFGREMPSTYTMKLDPGVTVGGIVVDENQHTIPNAKIDFDAGGSDMSLAENIQFGPDAAVVSDANGQWSSSMIPKGRNEISLHAGDADHAETNLTIHSTAADANKLVVTLPPGYFVRGTVADSSGNPVPNAHVRQVRLNEEHEHKAITDATGAFEFKAMAGGELMLAVQADGFAPAVQTLQLSSNVDALKFQLGPGQLLRGRIVDEQGNPVPFAFIETTRRGIDKVQWSTNADANGRFEWNSAPTDPLLYSVLAQGFNRAYAQTLSADGSDHVITLTHEQAKDNIQITGTVVDAETGQPLDSFKVFHGELDPQYAYPLMFFTTGKNGQFTMSLPAKSSHPGYLIEIEQDGYLPAASPDFQLSGGNQKLQFKLHKGSGPSGVVLLPNGQPAANASVLLCTTRSGVTMDGPAHVQTGINTTAYKTVTDSDGKFTVTPAIDPEGLIIMHDQGFAMLSPADFPNGGNFTLQPWGIIKGKLMIGSQPGANEKVSVFNHVIHYTDSGRNFGFLTFNLAATTDADGNFTFEKVPPGSCGVDHAQGSGETSYSSDNTMVTVTSGAITQVTLGGTGRTIAGKAILPAGSMDWSTIPVRIHSTVANAPTARPKREDYPTFEAFVSASDTYFHSYQKQKRFQTVCGSDGSFQVLNVPAGTYELKIEIRDSGKNSAVPRDATDSSPVLDSLTREIVISDDKSTDPVDLGTLELTPNQPNVSAR